jgi:hypothetical protein
MNLDYIEDYIVNQSIMGSVSEYTRKNVHYKIEKQLSKNCWDNISESTHWGIWHPVQIFVHVHIND